MLWFYLCRRVPVEREAEHSSQSTIRKTKPKNIKRLKATICSCNPLLLKAQKNPPRKTFALSRVFRRHTKEALHQSQFQLIFLVTNPDPVSEWVLALK